MDEETPVTATLVVEAAEVQPLTLAITEYVPLARAGALAMVGFCSAEVKPFGPVHEYVAPATVAALSWAVAPEQYGPVFDAVGVAGLALTTTLVAPAAEVQPFTVTVTEYAPAIAAVAVAIAGFCSTVEKAFGPVHA